MPRYPRIHRSNFSVPPNIDDELTSSDVVVNEGDDATMICKANGHPKPTTKWIREDRKDFPVFDVTHNQTRRSFGEW